MRKLANRFQTLGTFMTALAVAAILFLSLAVLTFGSKDNPSFPEFLMIDTENNRITFLGKEYAVDSAPFEQTAHIAQSLFSLNESILPAFLFDALQNAAESGAAILERASGSIVRLYQQLLTLNAV